MYRVIYQWETVMNIKISPFLTYHIPIRRNVQRTIFRERNGNLRYYSVGILSTVHGGRTWILANTLFHGYKIISLLYNKSKYLEAVVLNLLHTWQPSRNCIGTNMKLGPGLNKYTVEVG